MAANSIFWKLPDKFSVFSPKHKKKIELQAYVVEFRRLLPCNSLGFEEVSNFELLHGVVGLYDTCLPDITPDVLYSTVCGKWAKTLIFMRSLSDVLGEQEKKIKQKLKTQDDSSSSSEDEDSETTSLKLKTELSFLTEKHVHWEDNIEENTPIDKSPSESKNNSDDELNTEENINQNDLQKSSNLSSNTQEHSKIKNIEQSDSGVVLSDPCTNRKEERRKKDVEEDEDTSIFDGVFSDSEEGQESSDEEEEDGEDFSSGVDEFVTAAKKRKELRDSGRVSKDTIGIESLLVAIATYERNYGSVKDKVMQLDLLAVRRKFQKCGIGKIILDTIKDPTFAGPYDSIAVYADHSAVDFFKKNLFSDDVILSSRFSDLADHWINSKLMCFLPPFTGYDISGVHRSEHEVQVMENEIELWKGKSLEAYQAQVSCMTRMQHEIKMLKTLVDTQDEVIKTLTKSREKLQKEKFRIEKKLLDLQLEKEENSVKLQLDVEEAVSADDDFYDSLVNLLNKSQLDNDLSADKLDMKAIAKGDFGDVSKEDEELLSSLIHSQSEKQLIQQIRRSLLTTGQYNDVDVVRIQKVECSHISLLETNFDGRHAMPGHAPVVKQLFYCGDYSNVDSLDGITTRGFTNKDFTRGIFGRGLYFTKQPSQASRFSPPGKLLLANVNLGAIESVFQQDKKRTHPPAGFDSILTPGRPSSPISPRFSNQAEYVVFDPMQAVPVYLIEYSTSVI